MAMEQRIGQKVTLTLKNFSAARHGPFKDLEPDTIELIGTVMRAPRGHEDDADLFGFSVPFTEVPLRVVHIRHVVAVDGVPMVKAKSPRREWQVPASKGNTTYTVAEANGHWTCTCAAFQFRRACRHIKEKQNG